MLEDEDNGEQQPLLPQPQRPGLWQRTKNWFHENVPQRWRQPGFGRGVRNLMRTGAQVAKDARSASHAASSSSATSSSTSPLVGGFNVAAAVPSAFEAVKGVHDIFRGEDGDTSKLAGSEVRQRRKRGFRDLLTGGAGVASSVLAAGKAFGAKALSGAATVGGIAAQGIVGLRSLWGGARALHKSGKIGSLEDRIDHSIDLESRFQNDPQELAKLDRVKKAAKYARGRKNERALGMGLGVVGAGLGIAGLASGMLPLALAGAAVGSLWGLYKLGKGTYKRYRRGKRLKAAGQQLGIEGLGGFFHQDRQREQLRAHQHFDATDETLNKAAYTKKERVFNDITSLAEEHGESDRAGEHARQLLGTLGVVGLDKGGYDTAQNWADRGRHSQADAQVMPGLVLHKPSIMKVKRTRPWWQLFRSKGGGDLDTHDPEERKAMLKRWKRKLGS